MAIHVLLGLAVFLVHRTRQGPALRNFRSRNVL